MSYRINSTQTNCKAIDEGQPCLNYAKTKGFCGKHYARWHRKGTTQLNSKSLCKAIEKNHPCPSYAKALGFCQKHYGRLISTGTTDLIPRSVNKWKRLEKTRWTLIREQGYTCAICEQPHTSSDNTRSWHIDHNHRTGVTRGLLCHNCNLMLGHARNNPMNLAKAIIYLAKHDIEYYKLKGIIAILVKELS